MAKAKAAKAKAAAKAAAKPAAKSAVRKDDRAAFAASAPRPPAR